MSGTIEVKSLLDVSGTVAYAVLVVDGERPASTNAAPWTFELDTRDLSDGPHTMSIEAYDNRGMIASSKAITIAVKNQTARPAVAVRKQQSTSSQPSHQNSSQLSQPTSQHQPQLSLKHQTQPTARTSQAMAPVTVTAPKAATSDMIREPMVASRGLAPEPAQTAHLATPVEPLEAPTQALLPDRNPKIVMNGTPLETGVSPIVSRTGRMQTAFRALFAANGARIEWLADQRIARAVSDSFVVEVPIGSRTARVNGQAVEMEETATIVNGRTVVPLQFFAAVTGATIAWDAQTRVVNVRTAQASAHATHAQARVAASDLPPLGAVRAEMDIPGVARGAP